MNNRIDKAISLDRVDRQIIKDTKGKAIIIDFFLVCRSGRPEIQVKWRIIIVSIRRKCRIP
ncbi:hypothetical protein HC761_02585 [bacterium]|nr:hypothetical protein [bacterium]